MNPIKMSPLFVKGAALLAAVIGAGNGYSPIHRLTRPAAFRGSGHFARAGKNQRKVRKNQRRAHAAGCKKAFN